VLLEANNLLAHNALHSFLNERQVRAIKQELLVSNLADGAQLPVALPENQRNNPRAQLVRPLAKAAEIPSQPLEVVQESFILAGDTAELPQLEEDCSPGNNRKQEDSNQDELGERAGIQHGPHKLILGCSRFDGSKE